MLRESRLIGYTLEQLKQMGVKDTTTQYNSRTADKNVVEQQKTSALNYNAGTLPFYGNNVPTNVVPYTDPKTGQTVYHDAQGNVVDYPTAPIENRSAGYFPVINSPQGYSLADAQNTYANKDAGLKTQVYQIGSKSAGANGMFSDAQAAGNGELEQNAIDRMRASGMSDEQIRAKLSDPAFLQSISQTMSNTGLGGTFDPATGQFIAPKTSGLPDINSIKGYTTVVTTDPVTGRQITTLMQEGNATKQAQQQEMIRRTQQEQNNIMKNQKDAAAVSSSAASQAASNASKSPGTDTAFAALIDGAQDPALKSYLSAAKAEADAIGMVPAGQEMTRDQFNASSDAKALATPYDAIQKILDDAETRIKQYSDKTQTFLKDQQDRNDKLLAAQQSNIQEQLTWQEQKQTRDLTDANRKELDRMTVSYALRGGFGSDDANNAVSEARWKGEQAISDLQKEFGFKRTDVSLQFTDLTQQAHDQYTVNWLNAQNNLEAKLSDLDIQGIANQQAKGTAITNAYKGYMDEIKAGRKEYASKLTDAAKIVYDAANKERDVKLNDEKLGWQRMDWAAKTYGSDTPQAIIDSISKQLPDVDVKGALQNMTLAEMKQFKIRKGGGSSGTGTYATGSSSGDPVIDGIYAKVSPQQLSGAVERIFSPNNFGGTAGERNAKIAEYQQRIISGENPASIAASLQADFWSSQKGGEKTRHDERVEAQGSMESLQSFADYYSISGADDGPLGLIDSKVEGFKSIFGLSSEEYNNLSGAVGNIRAKIVKTNYGSAVTEQELALARSYIPEMTDKGQIFVTKLQNLKAYNAYLDAKQFAADSGLPQPSPPQPVTLSGNKMAGPGKYSTDDIISKMQ